MSTTIPTELHGVGARTALILDENPTDDDQLVEEAEVAPERVGDLGR